MKNHRPGGTFTPTGTTLTLNRMGYGTMQLPGPHVWGPPRDKAAALAVLREAVALGANHIDTAQFYGPDVANQLIKEALSPYPDGLSIVTKVGFVREADASWRPALAPDELERAVHENLTSLDIPALDVVNLRVGGVSGPDDRSIGKSVEVLARLQQQGLIRHLGLSNVTREQFDEAGSIAKIICVQNHYNLVTRTDDRFIDHLATLGVGYVPFFPLGGFTPLQSSRLSLVAEEAGATVKQVALAWLLQRAHNILVIAGTASVAHLRENFAAAALTLSEDQITKLNGLAQHAD